MIAGDAGHAEDAVQSEFAKAYASCSGSGQRTIRRAVRRMAVNEVLGVRRRGWWKAERSGPPPETVESRSAQDDVVDRAELWQSRTAPTRHSPLLLHRSETPFRASSKTDAQRPLVAFTQPGTGGVDVVLHDLRAHRTVETLPVRCSGEDCTDVVVDGVDRGLVFVRTGDGTFVWDPQASRATRWTRLGEGQFRVADARDGHVMWHGAPPQPAPSSPVADWSFIEGPIDAQLSFDGRHILYWSPRLEPTTPGDPAIELQVKGATWFTFDTDGSVLAAASGPRHEGVFYDCEIRRGRARRSAA